MPRFTLICDQSCDLDTHIVTHEFDAENLFDVVDNIDMFLRGAGYVYNGNLEFVEQETHTKHYYDKDRNR